MSKDNIFTLNKKEYKIVEDLLVLTESVEDSIQDSNSFFRKSDNLIINDRSYSFVNNYDNIEGTKCIGLCQTLLNNSDFDFSEDFSYGLHFNSNVYLISFDKEQNLLSITRNNRFDNIVGIELIDIEDIFPDIKKVSVIMTPSQIRAKSSARVRRIILLNIILLTIIFAAGATYYFYNEAEADSLNARLAILNNNSNKLDAELQELNYKALPEPIDKRILQEHSTFLLKLFNSGVDFNSVDPVGATNLNLKISIKQSDIPILRYLSNINNYQVNNITRDVKSGISIVDLSREIENE